MSTTDATRVAQLSLPGQTHVAEGPLDMSGMYVMHHAFRRDLDRFIAAVRQTPVEDTEVWSALAARWERFGSMLHHHHEIEDRTIWPPLVQRVSAAGDTRGLATLEAMAAEHGTIDPQLAACAAGFAAMVEAPDADSRERLAALLADIRDGVGGHLRHEEIDALLLVQRHLTVAEWQASEEAAKKTFAPRDLAFLVPWAATGLDRASLDRAFGNAGLLFRLVHRATRGRFAKGEAVPFRYA